MSAHRTPGIAACTIAIFALALVVSGQGVATEAPNAARGEGYHCPRRDQDGFRARRLIGLQLPQAEDVAERHDCTIRVTKRNGEILAVTDDLRYNRINVGVRHRKVTSIQGVY